MTKDVLLSISGLHQDVTGIEAQGDEPGNEPNRSDRTCELL